MFLSIFDRETPALEGLLSVLAGLLSWSPGCCERGLRSKKPFNRRGENRGGGSRLDWRSWLRNQSPIYLLPRVRCVCVGVLKKILFLVLHRKIVLTHVRVWETAWVTAGSLVC